MIAGEHAFHQAGADAADFLAELQQQAFLRGGVGVVAQRCAIAPVAEAAALMAGRAAPPQRQIDPELRRLPGDIAAEVDAKSGVGVTGVVA